MIEIYLFIGIVTGVVVTLFYDIWGEILSKVSSLPKANWAMVGRWFGYMARGRFRHENIANADPVSGELILGWFMHYITGIVYLVIFTLMLGPEWIYHPNIVLSLGFGWITMLPGWFWMSPCMGKGIASAASESPVRSRLTQFAGHTVFGMAIYFVAIFMTVISSRGI